MGELTVRRERSFAIPRFQAAAKAEKSGETAAAQKTSAARESDTVSGTLQQLMSRVGQAERQVQAGRRQLQAGEGALAEVDDLLSRMESAAKTAAAGDGGAEAQKLMEELRGEVERILQSEADAGLFDAGEDGDGLENLVDAVMDGLLSQKHEARLPAWLVLGLSGGAPDRAALLEAMGLDASASGADILAALGDLNLADGGAGSYLAALYLGAVIAGGAPEGAIDPAQAAEGLRQLLALAAQGVSPDEALAQLTGGLFSSLADFEAQFSGGVAPGLELFLMELLLSGQALPEAPSLLSLLDGGGLSQLMDLLPTLGGSAAEGAENADLAASTETPESVVSQTNQEPLPPMETRTVGGVQASGRDISGLQWDAKGRAWSVTGDTEAVFRAQDAKAAAPALRLSGSGVVTLQQLHLPLVRAEGSEAQLRGAGDMAVDQLRLAPGASLTLRGDATVRVGALRAGAGSVLRLTGGAVALSGQKASLPAVVVDGAVSLFAPAGAVVQDAQGRSLSPLEVLWKQLLPDWKAVTALAVDGRQSPLQLRPGGLFSRLQLWLWRGSEGQGYPVHTVALYGRDQAGAPRTYYTYIRWNQRQGAFETVELYPNPFTVTGGEAETDWRYEEATQTLRILSAQVETVSGGAGTDANQAPFSGRIALEDGIGALTLTLAGVTCRVGEGRAFDLGRENDVTLLLLRGSENTFASGAGFAGISLGAGTSLQIDQTGERGEPDGILTAVGGEGGAGIGRDSGPAPGKPGPICIRGGAISATGAGGGAGIGGALGAPAGEIRIQGGSVQAGAACCAAAIGSGLQGPCGDIAITGPARITPTRGYIGGCLFGGCGKVQAAPGTNVPGAKFWTQQGLSVQVEEGAVTLPRLRLSARALHLDGLSLATRETARAAIAVLAADRRIAAWVQGAYGEMHGQLSQRLEGLYSVRQYIRVVRSADEAGALLLDVRQVLQSAPAAAFLGSRAPEHVDELLRQ